MAHLLHLDSSPRGDRSHSRKLTREFVETWKQAHPGDTVTYRDIGRNPVPHVDEPWIAAAFTPPEQRTPELWQAINLSDRLIDELLAADIYVMGIPMYNYSVPSGFKAYIDQIYGLDEPLPLNQMTLLMFTNLWYWVKKCLSSKPEGILVLNLVDATRR